MDGLISFWHTISPYLTPEDIKLIIFDCFWTAICIVVELNWNSRYDITYKNDVFNPIPHQKEINKLHRLLIDDKL